MKPVYLPKGREFERRERRRTVVNMILLAVGLTVAFITFGFFLIKGLLAHSCIG